VTNRALVLAALGDGPAVIANPLRARDTALAVGALRALGSEIKQSRTDWVITPGQPAPGSAVSVDVGNAGTVMRFVPALAALTSAVVFFDGDERIRLRPIGPVLEALRQLGAQIEDGGRAAVPFTVHGRGAVRGGIYGTAANLNPTPDNPTLENSGNDVHYETDFRSVYAKVIDSWLGGDSASVLGGNFRGGAPEIL